MRLAAWRMLVPGVTTVLDALSGTGIPVVAAGGFFDGRGLAAALSYGAAGVGHAAGMAVVVPNHAA